MHRNVQVRFGGGPTVPLETGITWPTLPKAVVVKSGKVKTKQWTSMRDDARAKINIAAAQFPWFRWSVYYLEEGRWTKEKV